MDVQSLIEMLEPHKDKQMAKDYKIEIEDDKVVLKVAKRKVAQKKADIMKTVVQKIEDKVHYYNFKEFAYAFEHFCHQFGYMYVTKLPIDQAQIKRLFPNNTYFGREELAIIYTYIRIFDKQIKTPTYTSPTWGGLPYAMPKIRTALRASENRTEKVKEQDLCEEVY